MTKLECAAINHANEWLRYQRSPQAKRDAEIDRQRRADSDRKAGHLPACGILKCHQNCRKGNGA